MRHSMVGSQNKTNQRVNLPTLRHNWRVWGQVAYALLLTCVFPFVCWGQMGRADHPHSGPHFVFAPPPNYFISYDQPGPTADSLHPNGHRTGSGIILSSSAPLAESQPATGQSLPDTLSFFFLFLLIAVGVWLLYTPLRAYTPHSFSLGCGQFSPGLPLPPPRFAWKHLLFI